jgi:hypothetical protein
MVSRQSTFAVSFHIKKERYAKEIFMDWFCLNDDKHSAS